MSKLYFRYGTMNSGKSLQLLAVAHNYEKQNKKVCLIKPSTDTRGSKCYIESRVGVFKPCISLDKDQDIFKCDIDDDVDCILIDEAQFLTKQQVRQLSRIAWSLSIPVICYGLRNTYVDGELFEGSAALLYYADTIEEIKTTCEYCNKKATMNLMLVDGSPVYKGDTIKIGDINEDKKSKIKYQSVCKKHYYRPNGYSEMV